VPSKVPSKALSTAPTSSASDLIEGDVVVVGYSTSSTSKSVALLLLQNLRAGAQFSMTDNAYTGSAFKTSEGVVTFTASAAVPRGTVLVWTTAAAGWTSTPFFFFFYLHSGRQHRALLRHPRGAKQVPLRAHLQRRLRRALLRAHGEPVRAAGVSCAQPDRARAAQAQGGALQRADRRVSRGAAGVNFGPESLDAERHGRLGPRRAAGVHRAGRDLGADGQPDPAAGHVGPVNGVPDGPAVDARSRRAVAHDVEEPDDDADHGSAYGQPEPSTNELAHGQADDNVTNNQATQNTTHAPAIDEESE
jgi:hypothetical protein